MHPKYANNFFWKLIDTSKHTPDADSPLEIPVVAGSGWHTKAQVRNVVFCKNYLICEFPC